MSCQYPFETLYLLPDGYSTCCQAWVDPACWVIDREHRLGPWEAWNHQKFQQLRRMVLSVDWAACKTCPRVPNRQVPEQLREDWQPVMQRGPSRIIITNDYVCNLHCWSCRQGPIGVDRTTHERRKLAMFAALEAFRPWITFIQLLQSGEVFASPMHMQWLRSVRPGDWRPDLEIELTTNGTLMAQKWDEIANVHPIVRSIAISVDAGTQATYERVRRGGKWEDVQAGLQLAARLRREGALRQFRLLFCVQAGNFRDIPAYIRMAKELGADQIGLMQLYPWWQNAQEYAEGSVANPQHPLHAEYLRVLDCEELRWPGVEASQLIGAARQIIPLTYFSAQA